MKTFTPLIDKNIKTRFFRISSLDKEPKLVMYTVSSSPEEQ